jgi:hypothetical protein
VITPATARSDLLALLAPLGFRSGRIDLPVVWPAIAAWMCRSASEVSPEGDERTFYLSHAPVGAAGTFAGAPPDHIAAIDLICIELGRAFSAVQPGRRQQLVSVGVTLWYADGEPWESLAGMPGWIDMGPSTPNIDGFARGDDVGWFTDWIRASPAYAVASRETALAAAVSDNVSDPLIVRVRG